MVAENRLWRAWWRSSRRLLVLIISSQSICIRRRLRVFSKLRSISSPQCRSFAMRFATDCRRARRGLTRQRTGEDGGSITLSAWTRRCGCIHSQVYVRLVWRCMRCASSAMYEQAVPHRRGHDIHRRDDRVEHSMRSWTPVRAARSSWPPRTGCFLPGSREKLSHAAIRKVFVTDTIPVGQEAPPGLGVITIAPFWRK